MSLTETLLYVCYWRLAYIRSHWSASIQTDVKNFCLSTTVTWKLIFVLDPYNSNPLKTRVWGEISTPTAKGKHHQKCMKVENIFYHSNKYALHNQFCFASITFNKKPFLLLVYKERKEKAYSHPSSFHLQHHWMLYRQKRF